MNRKGTFMAATALIAVVVISAFVFSGFGVIQTEEQRNVSRAIVDFKRDAADVEFVASMSIADALSDAAYAGGACSFSGSGAQSTVGSYLNTAISAVNSWCSASSISVVDAAGAGTSRDVTVSYTLTCQAEIGEDFYTVKERTITIKKNVDATVVGGTECEVIVKEFHTSIEEVHLTETLP